MQLVDRDGVADPLHDPATDAPVARLGDGTLRAASPQRLPTTDPLAELTLGPNATIWVRTADGTVHLAPRHHYFGLNWGYGGSGPGALALLIHRLLDDTAAPAADGASGAPDGLEELTQIKWPVGTRFTRDQLLAARNGDLPDASV